MTKNIDHDQCSEQLHAYVRRDLEEPDARAVEEHLASCDACRAELAGLNALLGAEVRSLDLRERHELHEGVGRAIAPREPVIEGGAVEKRRSWAQRFAPTLGTAAFLLIVLVVAMSGLTGGGDGDNAASDAGGRSGAKGMPERANDEAQFDQSGGDGPGAEEAEALPSKENKDRAEETAETADGTAFGMRPRPTFRQRLVDELGAAAPQNLLRDFAANYTVADAERWEGRYVTLLSNSAPSDVRRQVQTCGGAVRAASHDPVLAASGALGRVDSRPGLFLSFVYTNAERGPLSSYMVWAWPRGSCSTRLAYRTGSIDD